MTHPLLTVTQKDETIHLTKIYDVAALWYVAGLNLKKDTVFGVLSGLVALWLGYTSFVDPTATQPNLISGTGCLGWGYLATQFYKTRMQAQIARLESDKLLKKMVKDKDSQVVKTSLDKSTWYKSQLHTFPASLIKTHGHWLIVGRKQFLKWQKVHS